MLDEFFPGWSPILKALHAYIEREHPGVKIDQEKEKFGTLRVYPDTYNERLQRVINAAEVMSSVTCSSCGAPGYVRAIRGWVYTMCDDCAKKTEVTT